jgi:hypothetical protein
MAFHEALEKPLQLSEIVIDADGVERTRWNLDASDGNNGVEVVVRPNLSTERSAPPAAMTKVPVFELLLNN